MLFAALAAGWPPGAEQKRLKMLAWCAAFLAGVATAVMIVATSFGNTRDKDRALLRVTTSTRKTLTTLCSMQIPKGVFEGHIITNTLNDEFVTVDFTRSESPYCRTIRIPRAALIAFTELPMRN